MKDWTESNRVILLVVSCCVIFSVIVGFGLALIATNESFSLSFPELRIPRFDWPEFNIAGLFRRGNQSAAPFMLVPPAQPDVEVEPRRLIPDQAKLAHLMMPPSPVVNYAKSYMGVQYLFAGEYDIHGMMDCSSFTVRVFQQFGVQLPRTTFGQVLQGREIATIEDMRPGDMIFFLNTWPDGFQTGVTHVGIYVGNREFIHCSALFGGVSLTSINHPFYVDRWHSIRRVIED